MLDPIDKISTDYLVESLTRPSDEQEDNNELVIEAFEGLDHFYSMETPEKDTIPVQYNRLHQSEFKKHARTISYQLQGVNRVVLNIQTRLYKLENPNKEIPAQYFEQKAPEGQELDPTQQQIPMTQQPSALDRFKSKFGSKPQNLLDLESPYRLNLNLVEEAKQVIQFWYKMINYHNSGLLRADLMGDKDAMFVYLNDEIKYFSSNAEPKILPIIGEAFQLQIDEVNQKIERILTSNMRVAEQHRLE